MQNTVKKVLITSSSDMFFSTLIRKVIYEKQPYKFISINKLSKNILDNTYINRDHQFYFGDVYDKNFIDIIFEHEKPNIIIHGAGKNSDALQTNVIGTQTILDASVKYGIEKIIFVSDDKVYGSLEGDAVETFKEIDPLNPNDLFASSKAAGELLVKTAFKIYGLKYNIMRLSNCYGQRQAKEYLIPNTIKCIMNSEKIPIHGQGLQMRDWVHVYDACSALLTILQSAQLNETYNVSANQEYTTLEVVQKICNTMDKGHDLISFIPALIRHDFRRGLNNSKIKELGWQPQYKLGDGLKETFNWFDKNQWFFKQ